MKEYEYNNKVMGTDLSIAIVDDSQELADNLASEALSEIQAYEKRFSRFLPESELSQLNQRKELIVSKIFIETIIKARELFIETKGIFNPLVQIERLGYDKTFEEIKDIDTGPINQENYDIDFSTVVIDQNLSKIILNEGQKLDFGGFLKGYLAEKIAKKIKNGYEKFESEKEKIIGVIVNLGGDIHAQGLDVNNQKFIFNIYNPMTDRDEISVKLYNESLATSGTYKRFWQKSGSKVHHILDASGRHNPKSEIISASIIHEDGGKSDALAKVFLSVGHEKAKQLFEKEKIQFIIIKNNGEIIKQLV